MAPYRSGRASGMRRADSGEHYYASHSSCQAHFTRSGKAAMPPDYSCPRAQGRRLLFLRISFDRGGSFFVLARALSR